MVRGFPVTRRLELPGSATTATVPHRRCGLGPDDSNHRVPACRRWSGDVNGQAAADRPNQRGASRGRGSKPEAQQLPAIMSRGWVAEVFYLQTNGPMLLLAGRAERPQRSLAVVPTTATAQRCRSGRGPDDSNVPNAAVPRKKQRVQRAAPGGGAAP